MQKNNTAIILVNLGTPDRPDEDSIRRYLKQFLSDERVVDWPRWLWLPVLNQIILRSRPAKLVEKYKLIWGSRDGPIRNITQALASRAQQLMPETPVFVAMTYGQPSVAEVLDQLDAFKQILVIPLFPQYAGATTGAAKDEFERALNGRRDQWQIEFIEDYCSDAGYIQALADSIRNSHAFRNGSPKIIFSFHGIPESQARQGDPYALQCQTTASLVAATLDLPEARWQVTFQSRFGPAAWLQPYTDKTMAALPGQGEKDVLVVCPGFSVDCLETIEEIKILNRKLFFAAGGESFSYVKALNASWAHAEVVKGLVTKRVTELRRD